MKPKHDAAWPDAHARGGDLWSAVRGQDVMTQLPFPPTGVEGTRTTYKQTNSVEDPCTRMEQNKKREKLKTVGKPGCSICAFPRSSLWTKKKRAKARGSTRDPGQTLGVEWLGRQLRTQSWLSHSGGIRWWVDHRRGIGVGYPGKVWGGLRGVDSYLPRFTSSHSQNLLLTHLVKICSWFTRLRLVRPQQFDHVMRFIHEKPL